VEAMLKHVVDCSRKSEGHYRCFECGNEEVIGRYHFDNCQKYHRVDRRATAVANIVSNSLKAVRRFSLSKKGNESTVGSESLTEQESLRSSFTVPKSPDAKVEPGPNAHIHEFPYESELYIPELDTTTRTNPNGIVPELQAVSNPAAVSTLAELEVQNLEWMSDTHYPQLSSEQDVSPFTPDLPLPLDDRYSPSGTLYYNDSQIANCDYNLHICRSNDHSNCSAWDAGSPCNGLPAYNAINSGSTEHHIPYCTLGSAAAETSGKGKFTNGSFQSASNSYIGQSYDAIPSSYTYGIARPNNDRFGREFSVTSPTSSPASHWLMSNMEVDKHREIFNETTESNFLFSKEDLFDIPSNGVEPGISVDTNSM